MSDSNSDQDLFIIKESLKASGLAVDLNDEELTDLAKIAIARNYKKGADIVSEGSTSRDLFIIQKGNVSICLTLPMIYFKEEVISHLKESEIFGEFSLANGMPRSATVKAEGKVTVHQYPYEKLIALMEQQTRIGYIVMRNLAGIIANRIRDNHKKTRKLMLGW